MEDFVARTSREYRLPYTVRMSVNAHSGAAGALFRRGHIEIRQDQLSSPNMLALIAHELGHAVNRDESGLSATSTAEWFAGQYAREVAAHVTAIDILHRAQGMTEAQALSVMHRYFLSIAKRHAAGGPPAPGHKWACEEWSDTLAKLSHVDRATYPCPRPKSQRQTAAFCRTSHPNTPPFR
jgi:hypothetical protein